LSQLLQQDPRNPNYLSKLFTLDPKRGVLLPQGYGFDGDQVCDEFGRPRYVNLLTVADFYQRDILAADRLVQPESARKFPLTSHQRVTLVEIVLRQFLFEQVMRGGAKTYTMARGFLDYSQMVPGTPIILTGPTFRQSLMTFDEVVKAINLNARNENTAFNIKSEVKGDIKRGTMEAVIEFKNGSSIRAVPMGDGKSIRGLRGGILHVDEFYQVTRELYESHLAPFVQVKQGGRDSKIIMTTTSWFQDCFAYERLMQIASEVKAGNPLYNILDFNLDDLTTNGATAILEGARYTVKQSAFPLSEAVWKDAQRHSHPMTYLMTYYNIWPDLAARWYEQRSIDAALSSVHKVPVELNRDKGSSATYFCVVDLAASDKGDSTCMMVFKNLNGKTQVVYGKKDQGWSGHRRAWETHELIRRFQPEFVLYDSHGAIGNDFRKDMSLETLVVTLDDGSVEIKTVPPVIHWDENNRRGDRLLIPTAPSDDAVIMALTDHRSGEVGGEDGMNNIMHTKTRNFLWEGALQGPGIDALQLEGSDTKNRSEYSGSEQEALDVVREAFQQLGKISLDRDHNGKVKTTKSGKLVFKKKPGASVDDGAFCLIYSSIGILRLGGSTTQGERVKPITRAMSSTSNPSTASTLSAGHIQRIQFL
jgi:hypothetical protein